MYCYKWLVGKVYKPQFIEMFYKQVYLHLLTKTVFLPGSNFSTKCNYTVLAQQLVEICFKYGVCRNGTTSKYGVCINATTNKCGVCRSATTSKCGVCRSATTSKCGVCRIISANTNKCDVCRSATTSKCGVCRSATTHKCGVCRSDKLAFIKKVERVENENS